MAGRSGERGEARAPPMGELRINLVGIFGQPGEVEVENSG